MDDLISRQAAINALERYVDSLQMISWEECINTLRDLPVVESKHEVAPISYKEQLSLDCDFCRQHECGDTLYESSSWDGGIGFDYIRNIRFCPICGRKLYGDE